MAPSENGPVTRGFQPKNDFFGPRSVLTPLTALETPKVFLSSGLDLNQFEKCGEKLNFQYLSHCL